jgi:hypothetical protein
VTTALAQQAPFQRFQYRFQIALFPVPFLHLYVYTQKQGISNPSNALFRPTGVRFTLPLFSPAVRGGGMDHFHRSCKMI